MKPRVNAIYVAVKDMDRAVGFYESVFDTEVSSKDERMSSFVFDNFTFLLFDHKVECEEVLFGNNAIPNIEVGDINLMLESIKDKGCEIVMELDTIGDYVIFQAKDTEGNIIEFYQMKK